MLDVKMELGPGLRKAGADLAQVEKELATSIAKALGIVIKARVMERGDLAGQSFPGYSLGPPTKPGRVKARTSHFFVSARYPDGVHGKIGPGGAEMFESSAEYHASAGVVPGSYNVTGGMWSGLSVMILTPTLVRLLFRGRSEGQDPRFVNGKSRPLKASNALKAWTVIAKHNVNPLAMAASELAGIEKGTTQVIARGLEASLSIQWQGQAPPVTDVFATMYAAINGR